MPAISLVIPGSGITPLNVRELTLDWWRVYVAEARELIAQRKARAARAGARAGSRNRG